MGSLVMRARGASVADGEPLKLSAIGEDASWPREPASATVAAWRASEPSPALKLMRSRPPPRPTGILVRYVVLVDVETDQRSAWWKAGWKTSVVCAPAAGTRASEREQASIEQVARRARLKCRFGTNAPGVGA